MGGMSKWESTGNSDEWYTPSYIFDALGVRFDIDVAAPVNRTYCHVPANEFITEDSLMREWTGFVWMNPPFGGRNGVIPWLDKMHRHGNGIALVPDRTSAPWFQNAARECELLMHLAGKPKFGRPDGSVGRQPSTGITLLAYGGQAKIALDNAERNGLGLLLKPRHTRI